MAINIKDFLVEMKMNDNGQIVFTVRLNGSNECIIIPAEDIQETKEGFVICFIHKEKKTCITIKIEL